jgi:hypothetical protein
MKRITSHQIARLTALAALATSVATTCGWANGFSDATLKTNITPLRSA